VDLDSSVYPAPEETIEIMFAQNFTEAAGKFVFCIDDSEAIENLAYMTAENGWETIFCLEQTVKDILANGNIPFFDKENEFLSAQVGITRCEFLIARTGSIMVSSRQASGRRLPAFPPVHIVFAYTSQLVQDIKDALKGMKTKYGTNIPSMISLITGPSRTADIEKTLVLGMHGPKEVYVFLIDDITD